MSHSSTVLLDPNYTELTLSGTSPFTLNIDASKADPNHKTYKIIYD